MALVSWLFGRRARDARARAEAAEAELRRLRAERAAIDRSMAMIRFDPEARVVDANSKFLAALGYDSLDAIRGRPHSMFCRPDYAASAEYRAFWAALRRGEYFNGRVQRISAAGEPVWLAAAYAPLQDAAGEPAGFVKIASDITERVREERRNQSILGALDRVMAVVEFTIDGTVVRANDNFRAVMGYRGQPVEGLHHRSFCEPEFAASADYQRLWRQLQAGEYFADRIRRRARDGSERWLQASYNPVFDADGSVVGVVKFATDITAEVQHQQAERESAEYALSVSHQTKQRCGEGVETVNRCLDEIRAMSVRIEQAGVEANALSKHSDGITAIVGTIRQIAEQTNLLALNAAIEAARAGDQGRGFAVVADEVRDLAARTARSTTEVNDMVAEIQRQTGSTVEQMEGLLENVRHSVDLTQASGQTMEQINAYAESVVEAIGRFSRMKS